MFEDLFRYVIGRRSSGPPIRAEHKLLRPMILHVRSLATTELYLLVGN